VAWLQVSLVVMLVWLRRALMMLLGEVSTLIVFVIRMKAPTVLMIMWYGLKSMAWPLVIASRGKPWWWVHRSLAFGELRIGRSLCNQGKCGAVGGFGLQLVKQHLMTEQLILEIIKLIWFSQVSNE